MPSFPNIFRNSFILGGCLLLQHCAPTVPFATDRSPPQAWALSYARQRVSALIVTREPDIRNWIGQGFSRGKAPKDADGGSASPITADGYFLTADHVLEHSPQRNTHILYGRGDQLRTATVRVVWRDAKSDLAVVRAPFPTPAYYEFASPDMTLAEGTPIFHGGLTTGLKPHFGALASTIPAQNSFSSAQQFPINIPLQPGDSGGPILTGRAQLIGVNSSVEFLIPMETPIFTESHGSRPNIRQLMKIIAADRRR
jgi:S1-C subfamily serine protease